MSCHHAPSFSSNPSLEKGPSSPFLFSQDTARKTIFSFSRRPEKIVFPKKNDTGIWSFLYYWERWHFFFPKMRFYPLYGKWKMIFLIKNTWKYCIFFGCSEKMVFSKRLRWNKIFLILSEKIIFFSPKTWYFFLWTENERWFFSRNTWKYDIFCIYV